MVIAFMLASLMPWVHNKAGFYLVLGSSNVDEALRGYLTKVWQMLSYIQGIMWLHKLLKILELFLIDAKKIYILGHL